MQERQLSRIETITSLRTANADMAFATAFVTLVAGVFLVGFVQALGGSDIWIGVLSAIPSLAGFLQIPGAIWGRGFTSFKRFVRPGGLMWRCFYLPFIALPLIGLPNGFRLVLLTVCVALASAVTNIVNPIYNDWLAELVPAQSRGYFFARRNAIATAVGAAVGILGALGLDAIRGHYGDNLGFAAVFLLGLVCAFISMAFFDRMPDLARPNPIKQDLRSGIRAIANPFGDRAFRRVLIYLAASTFGQSFAGNLFTAFARESLNLNYEIIQGTAVSMAIGNIVTAVAWGFVADKYGNKPLLAIAGFAVSLNPIAWILCRPGATTFDAVLLLTTHVLMGILWCGFNLCQFNIMLATAEPEDRANYLGAGMTITALVGGFAPLLGAVLMASLRHGFNAEAAYKIVFAVTGVLRFLSTFFLFPVKEAGSAPIKTTLKDLSAMSPKGVLAVRSLTRAKDSAGRAEAIANVGAERVRLAGDEIMSALHDPLPSVRRQASQALAQISDPRAAVELIHQLEEHPDLLEEETVRALGSLANPMAIPALITTLQSPSSLIRRASARALAQIGEKAEGPARMQVEQALARCATDATDPDLRRAGLQGIRLIGGPWAAEVVTSGILDPLPSVRVAAAEACSELHLTDCVDALRLALARYQDEASAEVAYALGTVGVAADIPAILQEAQQSVSMITRRRALLGVARLLSVQPEVYRLMLLNGMERDGAVMELTRSQSRQNDGVREAVETYANGNEPGALEILAKSMGTDDFRYLAETPVEEGFLVAATRLALVRRSQRRK